MAKKKDGGNGKKKPSKPPRIPAWQELVNLLKSGSYFKKVAILAKLKALGYDVNENSVSYVMTSARKRGNLCVYAGSKGYTSTPKGRESLVDIRKRRRISIAWLKNIDALIKYVEKNWGSLTAPMKMTDRNELRNEIKYNKSAVPALLRLASSNGLK
jgi:hypothetical protein